MEPLSSLPSPPWASYVFLVFRACYMPHRSHPPLINCVLVMLVIRMYEVSLSCRLFNPPPPFRCHTPSLCPLRVHISPQFLYKLGVCMGLAQNVQVVSRDSNVH
jgi:hypothetical protein